MRPTDRQKREKQRQKRKTDITKDKQIQIDRHSERDIKLWKKTFKASAHLFLASEQFHSFYCLWFQ